MVTLKEILKIRISGHHAYVTEQFLQTTVERPLSDLKLQDVLKELKDQIDALNKAAAAATPPKPAVEVVYVHLFCKILVLNSTSAADFKKLWWLRIFARTIKVESPNTEIIEVEIPSLHGTQLKKEVEIKKLELSNILLLTLISFDVPDNVRLIFSVNDLKVSVDIQPSPPSGIGLNYYGTPIVEDRVSVARVESLFELDQLSPKDLEANVTFKRAPELLYFLAQLFDDATKMDEVWLGTPHGLKPEASINSFKLIAEVTRGCKDQADLHEQAETMWHRLDIPSIAAFFVPKVNPKNARNMVANWIGTVTQIDGEGKHAQIQAQLVKLEGNLSDRIYGATKAIIQAVNNVADATAEVQLQSYAKELEEKQHISTTAMEGVRLGQEQLQKAAATFDNNYNIWKAKEQQREDLEETLFFVTLAVDVGIACYSGPSALINDVGKLSKAAKRVKNVKSQLKGKDRWKRMGSLCSKMEKVKAATDLAGAFAKKFVLESKKQNNSNSPTSELLEKARAAFRGLDDDDLDWTETKALWDEFEIEGEDAFTFDFKDKDIDGKKEYHSELKKFTARGRDLVTAQKEAQDIRRKLQQSIAFKDLLAKKEKELQVKSPDHKDNTTAVAEELIDWEKRSITRWLMLAIHNWVLATSYLSCRTVLPNIAHKPRTGVAVSAMTASINQLEDDLDNSRISSFQPGTHKVQISTADEKTRSFFQDDWKVGLKTDSVVRFAIPTSYKGAFTLSYVMEAEVIITGLVPDSNKPDTEDDPLASAIVRFGPVQIQHVSNTKVHTDTDDDKTKAEKAHRNDVYFYSAPMAAKCEFFSKEGKSNMHAVFQSQGQGDDREKYIRPCLFSPGSIVLLQPQGDNYSTWNTSNVSQIFVNFTVECASLIDG